ncbi:hypothetical protein ASPVEDRAFT_54268 [Aspergillus versicolor CBS 583.65]|uniref:Uncharacterized protein n=1 Tax=Aspergillus versicolor CBS 583.65 TaxID=1036611 RepID=A0A1L9PR81_ASPVE|nr:uncharacterized protein ASPVEDRAFT_54268 [Aspergillus versicolor CBS 583.65]OJJ04013.1 hypothetical protein ASPVEDRAFT_54268 [Aspergillus versicolor CBS 583.65]
MAPMAPAEYQSRHRHADRKGIKYLGPIESENWPSHWPETRRQLFHDITTLGKSIFGDFNAGNTGDSNEKPWRGQIKPRAAKLAVLAARCRGEGKNERSWRASLEHEVLHRFTVEVSCPTCRDRLWRSEIEAAVESTEEQALSLDERRRNRMPCRCPEGLSQNRDFHGVNMIFSDRSETSIHYNPPLPIQSGGRNKKKYELPDRVYGLIETDNLKALLDSADGRVSDDGEEKVLRDTLEASPFKPSREPLLFPFLLIEAKSDTSGDSAGVEMQSAFAIERLLRVQDQLRPATDAETGWITEPVVWFFGWHGQDWYVKGSFISDATGLDPKYCILDLWQGNICYQSSALQLLLIVDYIFDWARDGYRPSIINQLSFLAAREMQSFDPDIFSTIERRASRLASFSQDSIRIGTADPDGDNSQSLGPNIDDRLSFGVVRDAAAVEARFLALQITTANIETFMTSFTASVAVSTILRNLTRSWRVTGDTLSRIQHGWTGADQESTLQGVFYVRIAILLHVADDWTPTQQLSCLAISEEAIQLMLSRDELPSQHASLERAIRTIPTVAASTIEGFMASIKAQTIGNNLTAAIGMVSLTSSYSRSPGEIPAQWRLDKANNSSVGFALDDTLQILEVIHEIYGAIDMHSTDLLIHTSSKRTTQPMHSTEPCLWPQLDPICQDTNGCALVDRLDAPGYGPRYCLYILTRYSFSPSNTAGVVKELSEYGLHYSALPLNPDRPLSQYVGYLNRSTSTRRRWHNSGSVELLHDWIIALELHPLQPMWPGETEDSPIIILSSDESEGDPMENE